jgi:TatA/E family protein of Tat protein translocase
MMGIGFSELMVILVIIMIIFGAGKLPELGSAFGKSIKNFKSSMREAEEASAETQAKVETPAEPKAVSEVAESAQPQQSTSESRGGKPV